MVCFPRGPEGAHRIGNESERAARVLMFSTVVIPTATVYPDSDVLTLEGEKIKEITAFVVCTADTPDGYSRWPEYAADASRVKSVFERFGLPDQIN